jgi:putative FmdB family regulatory protein
MPIYDYRCTACGHTFDHVQSHRDNPAPAECPKCAQGPVLKFPSAPNFHLKGDGWFGRSKKTT